MLVIGIDPGTASTGYGLVREDVDGNIKAIDYGVIVTSPKRSMPERLREIYKQLIEILLLHQPESGAVEKLFFARNVRTAISVGQARGIGLLALAEAGIGTSEYSPLEIKQAVTGYGGADKRQVQEMVRALLELKETPKPDDCADALAVAICHIHSIRLRVKYKIEGELD
jgi:crossover junction endodeoxyribonuclease RuvC